MLVEPFFSTVTSYKPASSSSRASAASSAKPEARHPRRAGPEEASLRPSAMASNIIMSYQLRSVASQTVVAVMPLACHDQCELRGDLLWTSLGAGSTISCHKRLEAALLERQVFGRSLPERRSRGTSVVHARSSPRRCLFRIDERTAFRCSRCYLSVPVVATSRSAVPCTYPSAASTSRSITLYVTRPTLPSYVAACRSQPAPRRR